ncbi:unnamed protein product, partial [Prorocentrum cordatum]
SLGAPPIFKESLNLLWLGPRRTVASAGSVKWLAVVMRNAKCPLHSPAPSWGKKAVLPAQLERIARGIPVQTERGVAKDKHCAGARDDPRGTSQDRKRRATERLTADETTVGGAHKGATLLCAWPRRLTEERHVQTNAVEHGSQRPWRDEGAWRWAATNCPSPPVLQNAPSRPAKGRRGGGHANFEQGGDRKEGGNTSGGTGREDEERRGKQKARRAREEICIAHRSHRRAPLWPEAARKGPGPPRTRQRIRADAFVGEGATVVPAVGPVATVATSGGKVHLWLPFDGRWRAEASSARMAAPSQWRARRSYRRSCGRPRCQRGPRRGEGATERRMEREEEEGGGGGRGGK